ncbi:hypothetical protein MINTMi27_15600 [Mycobacterium intracellulare]|nr:hypothetical protein MINTMi27_15600 [Mycobacterium intracellulare]
MTNPIDRPDFNVLRPRPANPETLKRIRVLAEVWRAQSEEADSSRGRLEEAVREAKEAGHTYQQLADAVGVSIPTIQRMCK